MKKFLIIIFLTQLSIFAHTQVSVDISDSFYSDAQNWELRGLTSTLPQLRPYPLKVVERILSDVIENGSERDVEEAREYYEGIFSKSFKPYFKGSFKGKVSKNEGDSFSENDKEKALLLEFGLGGDLKLHDLVTGSYNIGLFCQTEEFSEYSPLYVNTPVDAIFDPTESGPFTNYMLWNMNCAVGTSSLYGTIGLNRVGFGPFHSDGMALNDSSYHSANIVFNATGDKFSYSSLYESIGATRNIKDSESSWLGGNKYLAFHAVKWHAHDKVNVTYYENIVFGPHNNITYFAPAPYMGLQAIGGANDNLQMGLLFEYKPVKGMDLVADFFSDDMDLNEMFKGNFDSKLRFGFQTGLIYSPSDSILSKISLNYTAIMPYVYAHWEYDSDEAATFSGTTWNYQNYTNGGINIGSTLDPNSDKISLSANFKPVKNLSLHLFGNLIRHSNSAEDFSDDEAAEYMLAKSGTYSTDGSLYMHQMFVNSSGSLGKHVDSAWEKLGFMTSEHKMYVAQLGFDAEYTFARTNKGTFSLCAGYTFEYVKNNGVNSNIYSGGLMDELNIELNGDGETYKINGNETYTWEQLKASSYVQDAVKAAKEEWVSNLYDSMNHYLSVSLKYRY